MRLRAGIVNFRSGTFAVACARSLLAEWSACGGAREDLELTVVDNASPTDEADALRTLGALGARVLRSTSNDGYGPGMNRALGFTADAFRTGSAQDVGADEVLAVLNPDLVFLPGSLAPLLERLRARADLAAVAPAAFVDEDLCFRLPPIPVPDALDEVALALAARDAGVAREYAARRAASARRVWCAREPVALDMLSGACLLLRRDAVLRAGGLFDERYPLYYEDTDLCARLRAAGLGLEHVPASRVLHHWARSSGIGVDFDTLAGARAALSRERYRARWLGGVARAAVAAAEGLARAWPAPGGPPAPHPFADLGAVSAPPRCAWSSPVPFVFELSLAPTFVLAAGALGSGDSFRIPGAAWEWLYPGPVWVRALARDTGALLGAWSFTKTTPARAAGLSTSELDALRAREGVGARG